MNQQAPNLPRPVQVITRYKALIGLLAVLGLLGGAVFAALNPPRSAGKALVMFAAPPCPAGAICGGPMFSPDYVLAAVLKAFPNRVEITSATGTLVMVTAGGGTAAQAEATANAAARSYIADTGSLIYLGEHASAQLLQPATIATGTTTPEQVLADALLGGVLGVLAGILAALVGSQASIDPPPAPLGLNFGEVSWETGTRYESTGVPLVQLAQEYAERRAARGD